MLRCKIFARFYMNIKVISRYYLSRKIYQSRDIHSIPTGAPEAPRPIMGIKIVSQTWFVDIVLAGGPAYLSTRNWSYCILGSEKLSPEKIRLTYDRSPIVHRTICLAYIYNLSFVCLSTRSYIVVGLKVYTQTMSMEVSSVVRTIVSNHVSVSLGRILGACAAASVVFRLHIGL